MSPIGKATVLAATFALGFAAAWIIKPSSQPSIAATRMPASASPSGSPVGSKVARSKEDGPDRQLASFIKDLDDARQDPDKKKAALARIPSSEFLAVIQEYAKRGGLTEMDFLDYEAIRNLTAAWHEKAPNAALQWVLNLPRPKDRQELFTHLIGEFARRDLDGALALLREHGKVGKGWNMPHQLGQVLGKRDADTMVRTLGAFISYGGSYSHGVEFEFAPDFDFKTAADGITAIYSKLGHGDGLALRPSNFVAEWTKRDPTAAWEWVREGNGFLFNDLTKFLDCYAVVAPPEEIAGMLVEAMALNSDSTEKFEMAWNVLRERPNATLLSEFLAQAPGGREENLRNLFSQAATGYYGNMDEFKKMLVQQMSAPERTTVLSKGFKNGVNSNDITFFTPLLRQLGHSDDEIRQMLPPEQK